VERTRALITDEEHWCRGELAMQPLCGTATLVKANDIRGHAAVLALFDEVLAAS